MNKKEKTLLPNRYGDKNYLIELGTDVYGLLLDKSNNYMRVVFDPKDNSITAVDPEGGPFIAVNNFKIKGKTVTKIIREDIYKLYTN